MENNNNNLDIDLCDCEYLYDHYFPKYEDLNLNIDECLDQYFKDLDDNKPNENSSERIKDIYKYLKNVNKEEVKEISDNLKNFSKTKIYNLIETVEMLNLKLIIESENEIKKPF